MTTLATAAVEVVADTDRFEPTLRQGMADAGASADRASRDLGRRSGRTFSEGFATGLSRLSRSLNRPLASVGDRFAGMGDVLSTALSHGVDQLRLLDAGLRRVGVSASQSNSAFYRLGIGLRDVGDSARRGLGGIAERLTAIGRSTGGVVRGVGRLTGALAASAASMAVMAGVTASLMALLPALGALLGSTATALLGGGLATIGIVAAAQAEEVQAAFSDMAADIIDTFTGLSRPIQRSLVSLTRDLRGLTADLAPSFEVGFATLGPSLTRFFSQITRSLRAFGPTIEAVADATADFLQVLGPSLGSSLERLAGSITGLVTSADPRSFAGFVTGTVDLVSGLLDLLARSTEVRDEIRQGMAPALEALAPLAAGLREGFGTAAAAVGEFHRRYLSALVDAIVAAEPLLTDFGEGFAAAGGLIERFLSDISPLLGAIEPFVAGFVAGFTATREIVADVFGELLDWLGPTEGGLRGLATWLGENETLMRDLGAILGTVIAAFTTWRLVTLGVTAANWLLTTSFRAIGVAIRSIPVIGWIIAGLTLLVVVIRQLWENSETFRRIVTTAWDRVSAAFETARDIAQDVFGDLGDAWSELTDGVDFADSMSAAWGRLTTAFETGWGLIEGVFTSLREGWSTLVDGARDSGLLATIWEGIQDGAQTMWAIAGPIFDELIETVGFLADLVSGERSLSDLGELISGWTDTLVGVGGEIAGYLIRQLERVPRLVISALSWFGSTIGAWLFEQLAALPERAVEALAGLPDLIADTIGQIPDQLADFLGVTDGWGAWFADLGETAVTELASVGVRIAEWFQELPGRVEGWLGVTDGWGQWFSDLAVTAIEHLQELGETIAEYIQGIPDLIRERIGDGAEILAWLRDLGPRALEFMRDYGPQILKGLSIAIGIVILGVPALLLGLLAAILLVLGTIAVELLKWGYESFSAMMTRAGQAISDGINNLVSWFQELPGRLLAAVAGLGESLATWGRSAVARLRTAITTGLNALATWWNAKWNSLVGGARGIWNGFVTWLGTAAGRARDAVMGPINTLATRITNAFATIVRNVGRVWATLRQVIAAPINWVITTAYTNGIKKVWDKIAGKFGGEKLPDAPATIKFAKGGIFPGNGGGVFSGYTPGRDPHRVPLAAFSGGESVLRPEVTKAWGARTTLMLNALARRGGVKAVRKALAMLFAGQNPFTGMSVPSGGRGQMAFARGGIVGAAGRAWSWLNTAGEDFAEGMADFLDDPKGVFKKMALGLIDFASIPGANFTLGKTLANLPRKLIEELAKQVEKLFAIDAEGDWINIGGSVGGRLGAALRFAKAQAGKPYIWGGVGPRGYDCSGFMSAIHNVILGKNPYSRRYTTHSFVGTSANGFRRNFPSPFTIGNTHASVGHMAGTLLRTNVESRGSVGVVVGSRARGTTNPLFTSRWGLVTGASSRGGRMGGEGILYDSGGILAPGLTLVHNASGKPETVRTYAQEERVARLVKLVEANSAALATTGPLVPAARIGELARILGAQGDGGAGTVINAPVTVTTNAADPETVAYKVSARIARLAGV